MGHWYTQSGESKHDADLRTARKEGLLPSVTTILEVIAKPGLETWKQKQLLLASLTLPRLKGEAENDYAYRVINDSKAQASKAMELGTAIHSYAEDTSKPYPEGYGPVCCLLKEWIDENLKEGIAEAAIVSSLGYAGRVDWMNDSMIVDFKTSTNMEAYLESHCAQLTAYAMGDLNKRLINVYISTRKDNPEIKIKEWNMEEKKRGWDIFTGALKIWQAVKKYYPEFKD